MILFCWISFLVSVGNSFANTIKPSSSEKHVYKGENVILSCSYTGNVRNLQWYRQYLGSRPEFLVLVTEFSDPDPSLRLSAKVMKDIKRVDLTISSAEKSDSAVYYCALQPTVTGNTTTLSVFLPQEGDMEDCTLHTYPFKGRLPASFTRGWSCAVFKAAAVKLMSFFITELRLSAFTSPTMFILVLIVFSLFNESVRAYTISSVSSEVHVLAGENAVISCSYTGNGPSFQWYRQYPRSRPQYLIFHTEMNEASEPTLRLRAIPNKQSSRVDLEISSAAVSDSAVYYCALVPTVTGNTTTLYKNFFHLFTSQKNTTVFTDLIFDATFFIFEEITNF
ncbi:uncharacterized protein [Misgurnus anguillicaudatus]|uniref:uncharacterized protein n=1 Tax=Misgurnus anguillicaudatus TaxID=75329 RepID=UPI003CCF316E